MQLCILKYGTDERWCEVSRHSFQKVICMTMFRSPKAWERSMHIYRETGKAGLGVCICSIGVLENILWICNLPVYIPCFLPSVPTKQAEILTCVMHWLLETSDGQWRFSSLSLFCPNSATVKLITCILLASDAT